MIKVYLKLMKTVATALVMYKSLVMGFPIEMAIMDGIIVYGIWSPFGRIE